MCGGKEAPELNYLRLKQALIGLRLKSWPSEGGVGIRDIDEITGKTRIQVFELWCYLITVEDEIQMEEAKQSRFEISFDLDNYKVLIKALKSPLEIISL